MRSAVLLSLLGLLLVGCQSTAPVATVAWAPSGNLLLSRNAGVAVAAERFTSRAMWPAVGHGYQLEEVTTYTQFEYDDQFFRDGLGGSYYRTLESIRSGVWVR